MDIIDTHCHITFPDFDSDRDAAVERSKSAGVIGMIAVATHPDNWQRTLDLAEGRTTIHVALGIHPHEASVFSPEVIENLKSISNSNARVIAIGETGLDFFRNHSPSDKQFECFRAQLRLSRELDKPFILHCRSAEREMMAVLKEHRDEIGRPLRGVWHCFTSTPEYAEIAIGLGLHFGLGGVVTYPKSDEIRAAVKTLPDDRLLLETDCPYLPPQGWRGQRNEPAYLPKVVDTIATVRSTAPEEICRLTTANAKALFRI